MDIYSNPISGFPPKDCGNDGSKSKNSFSKTTIMLNSYDKSGNIITRWDNAEHWKNIETFPHHLHKGDEVFSSREVTLDDVLEHIYGILRREG